MLKHALSLHVLYQVQKIGLEDECVAKFIQHRLEMLLVRLAFHETIDQSHLRANKGSQFS
jgi:hypothetical protein